MELQSVLKEITKNNLIEAKNFLISNTKCNNTAPINILVTLCKLANRTDIKVDSNDLFDTTQLCCTRLINLNDNETEKCLMALYHIIRYFLMNKKSMEEIIILCDYVKTNCVDTLFKSAMYGHFAVLFHNEILVEVQDIDRKVLLKIILLSLKMQTLDPKYDSKAFFSRLNLYISLFRSPKTTIEQRNCFCFELSTILDYLDIETNKEIVAVIYRALMNLMSIITADISSIKTDRLPSYINTNLVLLFRLIRKLCGCNEVIDCVQLLENVSLVIIKDLNEVSVQDIKVLVQSNQILEVFKKKYRLNIVIQTCNQLVNTLKAVVDYFVNCITTWSNLLKTDILIELVKIFNGLGHILSKSDALEPNQKNTMIAAVTITYYAGYFIDVTSRLNLQISDELHTHAVQCLRSSCTYLLQLKEIDPEKCDSIWRVVGKVLYNIAVILHKNKNYKCSCLYSHLLSKNVSIFEGVASHNCFENAVGASLHLYATSCSSLGQNKQAFIYLGMVMLVCPVYRSKALHSWIVLKSSLTETEPLKSITINHILKLELDEIRCVLPNYQYDQTQVEPLLMQEFQYYIDNWPSKTSLYNCCNELCVISQNILNRTTVFVLSWDKVLHLADTDYNSNLETTIEMIKDSNDVSDIICFSLLNYVLYQCRTIAIMNKNLKDMKDAEMPLKSAPLPFEEPVNPNDKCDIVPAYYNMKIENLVPLYEILNNCLDLWYKILNHKDTETVINLGNKLNIDEIIKETAFEFRLQYLQYQMLKTWTLYLKFGKLFNNDEAIVTSIGFILEFSNCETNLDIEAEQKILLLNSLDTNHLHTIITYYINKSTGYLRNNLFEKGYKEMCIAEKYAENITEMDQIVEARLLFLKTCYLLVPCKEEIMPHEENFLVTMQHAYTIIAEFYKKTGGKKPYLLSTVLEISLADGWLFKQLRLPREARCYTKDSILLSQKYLLPIKTSQFLSLLSFIDLLDRQYDDCEVKLNGLSKILCYGSGRTIYHAKKEKPIEASNVLIQLDNIIPVFQTVLDIPHRPTNTVHGSPELSRKPFAIPEFIKHFQSCVCYKCLNMEYQKLILDSIHLEAVLNSYQNRNAYANDYFHGGFLMYEELRKKSKSFSGINLKSDTCILKMELCKNMSESYCEFMLDLSYFFAKTNLNEASNILKSLLQYIGDGNRINNFLWTEIFVQQLNLCDLNELATKPKSIKVQNELNVISDTILLRTPENNLSKPKIVLSLSPSIPSNTKVVKKIAFDLVDSDESDVENPKTPVPTKNTYFKFQTPAKTPAAKIKIYTPHTVKKTRKTVNTPSTTKTLDTIESIKKSKTPTSKQLEQRTRLLTEKLKSEITGVLTDCNSSEVNIPKTPKQNAQKSKQIKSKVKLNLDSNICNSHESKLEISKTEGNVRIIVDEFDDVIEAVDSLTLTTKRTTRSTREENIKVQNDIQANKRVTKPRKMVLYSSSSSDDSGIRRSTRSQKS